MREAMSSSSSESKPIVIREVWAHNVFREFSLINSIIPHFSFISMDTEFPGTIYRSSTTDRRKFQPSDIYQTLKANVDNLNLIQLGLTLTNAKGELPCFGTNTCFIWEFNFNFDLSRDLYSPDSIELLERQGIDFNKNRALGIDFQVFAYLFSNSNLVLERFPVTWITFHGAYDVAYLIKLLTWQFLPDDLSVFMELVKYYFGENFYDMKYIMKFCGSLYGGLEQVAKTLEVDRAVGKCHQAGSDSLLTWKAYSKMNKLFFGGDNNQEGYNGILFGFEP